MEIRCLGDIGFDQLFEAFEAAFSDYEISFDKEEVRAMLIRRGYDPRLSFGAFDSGKIVSFTLNGIGLYYGLPTAYDTGTGTVAAYRGKHLAGKIFNHSLPYHKEAGIRQYLLEVLQSNQMAINVYQRMRFGITREFDCFRQATAEVRVTSLNDSICSIKEIPVDIVKGSGDFCDFRASWQNSIESIERGRAGLRCLGAFVGDAFAGYCVFDPLSGDISQIAVKKCYRRKGIASQLLAKALDGMRPESIKVLNIPADDTALHSFLSRRNIPAANSQYEMILPL